MDMRARKRDGEPKPKKHHAEMFCPDLHPRIVKSPRILKLRALFDERSQPYLPYCNFQRSHPGLIREGADYCLERDCIHLYRIYFALAKEQGFPRAVRERLAAL